MPSILKAFRSSHAFYAEVIVGDRLVLSKTHVMDYEHPIAFVGFDTEIGVDFEEYSGFDFETSSALPGYLVITFYKGGRSSPKQRLRSYLYGPSGYVGEFSTPFAAFHAAGELVAEAQTEKPVSRSPSLGG